MDQDDPSDGSRRIVTQAVSLKSYSPLLFGRWVRDGSGMDQDGSGWISAQHTAQNIAFFVPGQGFEDGSRRSIGWIKTDRQTGRFAWVTLPALTWAMGQEWIRMDQRTADHAKHCQLQGLSADWPLAKSSRRSTNLRRNP